MPPVLLAVALTTLLVGHVLKIAYDELLGIASGVTGNPAILAYASRAVPTDRPDIGYALIFPGATLVKIVVVNVLTALFAQVTCRAVEFCRCRELERHRRPAHASAGMEPASGFFPVRTGERGAKCSASPSWVTVNPSPSWSV